MNGTLAYSDVNAISVNDRRGVDLAGAVGALALPAAIGYLPAVSPAVVGRVAIMLPYLRQTLSLVIVNRRSERLEGIENQLDLSNL